MDGFKKMARLKNVVKLHIVRSLAVFNTPTEVTESVQQEFGLKITRQICETYDPTKRSGQNLSKELCDEFHATRKQFVENTSDIPIANSSYRLQRLQRVIDHAGKNHKLAMEAMKQAAMEVGGAFTNRKEITGKDGAPIQQTILTVGEGDKAKIKEIMKDLENEY